MRCDTAHGKAARHGKSKMGLKTRLDEFKIGVPRGEGAIRSNLPR